jgi:uncharacterized membrane-anchored protein YhcB (DUF1043 family)
MTVFGALAMVVGLIVGAIVLTLVGLSVIDAAEVNSE